MSYGMYLAAEGAQAQSRRLEVIANNMANVDTVGFKPDVATFQARFAEAIQQNEALPGSRTTPDMGGGVKIIETTTNFSPGKLQRTGNESDLAIIGPGFFQVAGPDGEPMLTRAGAFETNAINQLVMTGSNNALLSQGGSPIEIDPTLPWSISRDGSIEQAGSLTPISLVEPASLDSLQKVGSNLFRSRQEPLPIRSDLREVRPGFQEMSGSNSTEQMMAMIETNRAFEANTQMIRHQDTATGSLISRVLSSR